MKKSSLQQTKKDKQVLGVINQESRKLYLRTLIGVGILLALGLFFGLKQRAAAPTSPGHFVVAALGGHAFQLDLADTPALREHGLSGRTSLANTEGMLFEFQQPEKSCFWMKDMRLNIDILWFDADKKLIHQQQNAAPSSYPAQSFCSPSPALYVVEIKPGITQLKLGDPLVLQKQ